MISDFKAFKERIEELKDDITYSTLELHDREIRVALLGLANILRDLATHVAGLTKLDEYVEEYAHKSIPEKEQT